MFWWSAWVLCPVCSYTAPYTASCSVLCVSTPGNHGLHWIVPILTSVHHKIKTPASVKVVYRQSFNIAHSSFFCRKKQLCFNFFTASTLSQILHTPLCFPAFMYSTAGLMDTHFVSDRNSTYSLSNTPHSSLQQQGQGSSQEFHCCTE